MEPGAFCIVLHAHLPYVRHPEYDDFLEEDWLFEAITETYLPLLGKLEALADAGVQAPLALSVSPTLSSMWRDALLCERYLRRVKQLTELAEKEIARTRGDPAVHRLAHMYRDRFAWARQAFAERYGGDLIGAFRQLRERGAVELMTCAATHALLPLLLDRRLVRVQVELAVRHHEQCFGERPRGIWLPECGYDAGLDAVLAAHGIEYFVLETHGIAHAVPRPRYGVFAPVRTPGGPCAFGRDPESSRQVWSALEGYPGDPCYREFHRDIGFDLDYAYLRPYLHGDGARIHTGIKYHRITGPTGPKDVYDPDAGRAKAEAHAEAFVASRAAQMAQLGPAMGRAPVVCAPYDAELFGHWWFEGPDWLEAVCRRAAGQGAFCLATPSQALAGTEGIQTVTPALSTWGWKGYNEIWLAGENDWIYRHLHAAGDRMTRLAAARPGAEGVQERALNQMARELLLAQQSDWAFMIKTGTMVEYAVRRTRGHLANVLALAEGIETGAVDEARLADLESRNNIFPDMDYRLFAG
jgi:1,4-alpha-glucan branching enzyme